MTAQRALQRQFRLSLCLSVCPSHACFVAKRRTTFDILPHYCSFLCPTPDVFCGIPTWSPLRGSVNYRRVVKIARFSANQQACSQLCDRWGWARFHHEWWITSLQNGFAGNFLRMFDMDSQTNGKILALIRPPIPIPPLPKQCNLPCKSL